MKKVIPDVVVSPNPIDTDKSSAPTNTVEQPVSPRPRDVERPDPVSNVFTIIPNVDIESLLCHASENLASLSVMSTDLADEMDGSRRNIALAMQQLCVLCELLVNRALDELDASQELSTASSG